MPFGAFPFSDMYEDPLRGAAKKNIDNEKFYNILGVSKNATPEEIKKAYHGLIIQHHPDKGGDSEKFKEISRVYEVLRNPEKRSVYDQHGEKGLESTPAESTDIFDLFFGGAGRRRRGAQGKRKGEDIESPIKVTLEQIYNGATRKMAIGKDVICDCCDGLGGPKETITDCDLCNGTGVRVHICQIGPMIQQSQTTCTNCRQGKVIPENKKCCKCGGIGTCKERKVLEVFIEKGAPDGHRIVFSGEADEKPDTIPGDVRFIIDQQEHPVFKRRGANLSVKKEITLFEALTGYKFVLNHLDGRKLLLESRPGDVTSPGDMKIIRGEGMPIHKNPFDKGHLFIEFVVKMPKASEMAVEGTALKNHLKKVLPVPSPLKIKESDDYEPYVVEDVQPDDYHHPKHPGGREEGYEEDEEGGRGEHRVQCNQQ